MSRHVTKMKQERNLRFLDCGFVMQSNDIYYFKLFGKHYTTNFRRRKLYSMDDFTWVKSDKGFFWKLKVIYKKEVKCLTKI